MRSKQLVISSQQQTVSSPQPVAISQLQPVSSQQSAFSRNQSAISRSQSAIGSRAYNKMHMGAVRRDDADKRRTVQRQSDESPKLGLGGDEIRVVYSFDSFLEILRGEQRQRPNGKGQVRKLASGQVGRRTGGKIGRWASGWIGRSVGW